MKFVSYTIARADTGAVLPYARVTVYQSDGTTVATIYDAGGSTISNPVTADATGTIGFAAPNATYVLKGVSADGTYTVPNIIVDIFDLNALANALATATVAGMVAKVKTTKALLLADLAATDGQLGLVYADTTATNNDIYVKSGASGSGSWSSTGLFSGVAAAYAAAAAVSATAAAGSAASAAAVLPTKSGLAELGTDPRALVFAITDPNKRAILWGFGDGSVGFKFDTTSPAATWVTSQIAASTAVHKSDMAQETIGSAIGSTPPSALIYAVRDASGRFLFGIGYDGAFEIGKYDAKLQRAALGASTSVPYIDQSGGQIIARYGSGTATLTSEGTNSNPQRVGNRIAFLSDRFRSITQPYVMDYNGANQRAFQVDRAYEGFFITGQSLAAGYGTSAISNSVYPQNAYCLTGGPVHDGGSPATAPLISLREVTKETIATSFATAVLDSELAFRPENRLVLFGNPVSSTAYSGLKQGTTPYNNTLTEISNILAINPSFVVRGFGVIHGEQDAGSSTYATDLQSWQANYETDIKALTGQGESVIMFVSQTASIRYYYPTTMNAHKSALAALAASVANSKVVFVCPEYFLTYQSDNLHITGASERLLGEYFAKAYRKVICEGRDWRGVSPRSFALGSNYVDVQFWVPVAPLVLDTALCTDPGNYGFNYVDDSGRTISSVALKGGTTDTVRITLSGTIGAHAVLDYAYNNGTASTSGPTGGARGCLRDSDPALSRWDGTTHLYNPCAIFQQALN